ncbi:hypothetical protein FDENT_2304 [Fusarium denticulatum]|uniref:Uncharacterized protein n=1 Tax=Fusarium denticulatum TaxID=48507 RepID=A0A8H5XG48_9HYPO|nr:hypothetical protein FDENT_2304 [Fusarium denticulatum]
MFNLTSPSDASRKVTKKASRVMSSLKSTLLSTLSKTPKQHLKEQKPKYQLCSNPTITITDAETGEEWDFIDHDELDGDLASSDDTRTLREELEINAREQEDLLYSRRYWHGQRDMLVVRRNSPVPVEQEISQRRQHRLESSSTSLPSGQPSTTSHNNPNTNLHSHSWTPYTTTLFSIFRTPKLPTTPLYTHIHQPTDTMGMKMPSDPSFKWPEECNKPSMFSKLVQKVATMIMGPSDEEKDRELKEGVVVQPEDATEPWEVVPTVKDEPWSVVVKSHNVLTEFDDSAGNRQTPYERTYQYEFDRRVVQADRIAQRKAEMRASK